MLPLFLCLHRPGDVSGQSKGADQVGVDDPLEIRVAGRQRVVLVVGSRVVHQNGNRARPFSFSRQCADLLEISNIADSILARGPRS